MGKGNHIFRIKGITFPSVYIETDTDDSEVELDIVEDLITNICEIDKSFVSYNEWFDNQKVIGETDNFKIVIADNEWSLAICCIPKSEDEEFDSDVETIEFKTLVNCFFRELSKYSDLHTRTSAWTSGKVNKGEKNIAYDI